MSTPTVSVVMPVFNGAAYLGQAIDSVLAQTFTDFELLVVDDGSTDSSAVLAAAYGDPRLRLVKNEGNQGLPFSRNRGVELARGEYIAFLDSDDVALPSRLTQQLEYLRANPAVAGVGANAQPINADGTVRGADWACPGDAAACKAHLLFGAYINTSTFTVRRQVLLDCRFDPERALCEDYDLYIRLTEHHQLLNLPLRLIQCRVHAASVTHTRLAALREAQLAINCRQLKQLGIAPSAEQLQLHRHIERLGSAPTPALLDSIAAWLDLILAANDMLGIYDRAALRAAAGERWHALCEDALRTKARWAWRKYYSQSLSSFHSLSVRGHLKLMARLLVPKRALRK